MKKIIVAIAITLSFVSCKKDNVQPEAKVSAPPVTYSVKIEGDTSYPHQDQYFLDSLGVVQNDTMGYIRINNVPIKHYGTFTLNPGDILECRNKGVDNILFIGGVPDHTLSEGNTWIVIHIDGVLVYGDTTPSPIDRYYKKIFL